VTTNLRKEEIVQEAFIKTGRVWNCILTNEVYKLKHIKHIGNHLSLTKRGFIKYGYNPVVFDNPLVLCSLIFKLLELFHLQAMLLNKEDL
jgi:hypothetical protein